LSIFVPAPMRVSPQRASVDGGIGADLHVVLDHQFSLLRKGNVFSTGGVACVTEAGRSQHGPSLYQDAIANHRARINGDVGQHLALLAQNDTVAQHSMWANAASLPHSNVCTQYSRRMYAWRGVAGCLFARLQKPCRKRKVIAWIAHRKHAWILRVLAGKQPAACQNCPGSGLKRGAQGRGVRGKNQRAGRGRLNAGHGQNLVCCKRCLRRRRSNQLRDFSNGCQLLSLTL
jgi:hypothetical protein